MRHILCEKHSKATEALEKIQVRTCMPETPKSDIRATQEGQRFDKVAQEYSEDKAKGACWSKAEIDKLMYYI